jgi:sigma-B regulation protein RsbU (phosphoserine phosphatase)
VAFEPGDLLLFFSDGITEARDAAGEFFGMERLVEFVRSHADLEPAILVEAIRKAVLEFSGSDRLNDDLTSVAIRVEEKRVPLARAELEIRSDLKQLRQAREFVRNFCANAQAPLLDEDRLAALELAVNEAASNIMKHAYHGREDQWIHLEGEAYPESVSIRLHHRGDPFDPSAARAPALDGSRESGYGAYIISRSVDRVRYYRDERGRNCVDLTTSRNAETRNLRSQS